MSIIKKIRYSAYALNYLIQTKILRKEIPFMGGLVINERCNLDCRHCAVKNRRDIPDLSFNEAREGLQRFYKMGIRNLYIEGGEPFLWRDKDRELDDIVLLAREMDFHFVTVYTNGTLLIEVSADTVFVSIDGLKETTNKLRGRGRNIFDLIIKNIKSSSHPNIIVNFTINSINKDEIEEFCKQIAKIEQIKGVFFYFHTPYYGFDDLFIDLEEKRRVIKRIIDLKKQGYRIFNSYACLKEVYEDSWLRPSNLCYLYANNKLYQCCRAIGKDKVCKNCGYLGYAEILNILKLKPSAILSALNYLS